MSFLEKLNSNFLELHAAKEKSFWQSKMALKEYKEGEFEKNEVAYNKFISNAEFLPKIREELKKANLSETDRHSLNGWLRFFEVNSIESAEARKLQDEESTMVIKMEEKRAKHKVGYRNPKDNSFVPTSSPGLSLIIRTAKDEALRKAAWQGALEIGDRLLEDGYIELIKKRNTFARSLGYTDYYDYNVQRNEGFSKEKLFEILDELEKNTRGAGKRSVDAVVDKHGDSAREPWNYAFFTAGDLTEKMDPYFPFSQSMNTWGTSFTALGVKFSNATLTLDLVDRQGKYENGFMHGPFPAYVKDNKFLPAHINFTANAVPGQIGSGYRALTTFLHEGGHAAHFSNIKQPAPCFSTEFSPTSVALAETQSMFLDCFASDPDWRIRYAKNLQGESMPIELIRAGLKLEHEHLAGMFRSMLVVCYAEKALYEMSEEELTPENIKEKCVALEQNMLFLNGGPRPLLSIPHLLGAAAYYHGYVLAQMAVYQTRAYLRGKHGTLLDNPKIGPELAAKYWQPGNSRNFLECVEDMTGEPFSAKATVELVNRTLDEVYAEADTLIAKEKETPAFTGTVDLDAIITAQHGDEIIATTQNGESFETMQKKFSDWIQEKEEAARNKLN